MSNEEKLTEKLKYLYTMAIKDNFEIQNLWVDLEHSSEGIEGYEIRIKFDYLNSMDSDVEGFSRDVRKILLEMSDHLSEYIITKNGKLETNGDGKVFVASTLLWNVTYKIEELHLFDVSYRFQHTN